MTHDNVTRVKKQVVQLNRILANEGVLDAFGHASLRDPERSDRFFLPRACAPELVEIDDVFEFGLDGEPVEPVKAALYSERVIHSSFYQRRPDIGAVLPSPLAIDSSLLFDTDEARSCYATRRVYGRARADLGLP